MPSCPITFDVQACGSLQMLINHANNRGFWVDVVLADGREITAEVVDRPADAPEHDGLMCLQPKSEPDGLNAGPKLLVNLYDHLEYGSDDELAEIPVVKSITIP